MTDIDEKADTPLNGGHLSKGNKKNAKSKAKAQEKKRNDEKDAKRQGLPSPKRKGKR